MLASTIALDRFGLGARPDEQPPADPKQWLLKQLDRFDPCPAALANVSSRAQVVDRFADYLEAQRMVTVAKRQVEPGLADSALYEGRDLKPTTDLDALIAGALAQHCRIEEGRVLKTLFPDSRGTAVRQPIILA
jgi:hypothetical protein